VHGDAGIEALPFCCWSPATASTFAVAGGGEERLDHLALGQTGVPGRRGVLDTAGGGARTTKELGS